MTSLDLSLDPNAPAAAPWLTPETYWPALTEATRGLDTPVGALHLGALRYNTRDMLGRAAGSPIRVASKSLRVRGVLEAVLALPGYRGVLAYTLAEALWLAETLDDIVVGYPSVDRTAIRQLARSAEPRCSATWACGGRPCTPPRTPGRWRSLSCPGPASTWWA